MVTQMRKFCLILKCITFFLMLFCLAGCQSHFTGVLNPKGVIAFEERKLLFDTLALMLIVVLPVIIMSFAFVYHYQISHRINDYKPDWGHSYFLEALWWGIPFVIVIMLGVITWKKTHELDPFAKINGHVTSPLLIDVIALPWKWLFIYPEQGIATINYLAIPVNQEVIYSMTTDNVPLSAFFIPQLGSQIYTMAGMRSQLHLIANEVGVYDGMNTQYNGDGFSDMHFEVHAVQAEAMENWFNEVKNSPNHLNEATYKTLLNPTINDKPQFFSGVEKNLLNRVMHIYMNSMGPVHPRNDQLKYKYQIN